MTTVVGDIVNRFVAAFPSGDDACLFAESPQAPDATSIDRAPYWTVSVRGRHNGQEGAHALILLTVPSRAADAPEVLEFAVRQARANKAPYFVTWTMRDAMLWRTPRPGVPAVRDSVEKLRDYPYLFEVRADSEIAEPVRLRIVDRGREIIHHLDALLKREAIELLPVFDSNDYPYFKRRLTNAFRDLVPYVERCVRERLGAEAGFREELSAWGAHAGAAAILEWLGGLADPHQEQIITVIARVVFSSVTELKETPHQEQIITEIASLLGEPGLAGIVAQLIVFRLLRKILIYQTVRSSRRALRKLELEELDTAEVLPALRAAFAEAGGIEPRRALEENMLDQLAWPARASKQVAILVSDLNTRDFSWLPEEYIEPILRQARLGKRKPKRGTRAEMAIRDDVAKQLLPNGPRRFPREFVSPHAGTAPGTSVELPETPLIFEDDAFFTGVRTSDNSFKRRAMPPEAKYLLYAHRAGLRSIWLPGEPVELRRAVADYEKYLRQLSDQLRHAYLLRTFDATTAERLTRAVFDRFGLPLPESIG